MQLITGVIQPHRLQVVKEALKSVNVHGLTVTEATGYGTQGGHSEVYRGAEVRIDFVAKKRIEVLVADEHVESVIEMIVTAARTGSIGDGKIWTVPVHNVVRVRTGERGPDAI
ncbi:MULTISPECIES: P-II family nitrogen regulator [unclassified Pseudoclavibacter]|uniref:P-II family nitrogen regulator n=1 Tax=unclassified Pseudoclavibacter TaxID=2615177 RepID=UPI001301016E|nr:MULTISPECIES: P-II family nitrogen regulator [unclassified Pseudoclavibacter]KAB1657403.1 P-II family nitrogen regulator [Pseudoclavibacter sp. CFCC 11306]KAB1660724.1 P-II family nitrogen regulator [Pseudoclavibacter sp. CFCC 13796]